MKSASPALATLLATSIELPFADCFTFTTLEGDTYYWTNFDTRVYDDACYVANSVRVQGLKFKQTAGVDIDEQSVTVIADQALDAVRGVPFLTALQGGYFDKATVTRRRAFFDPETNWPPDPLTGAVSSGSILLFKGRVTNLISVGRTTASFNVKSDLVQLDQDFPRNFWQASCVHTLYGSGCTLNRNDHATEVLIGSPPTTSVIPCTLGGSGATVTASLSGTAGQPITRVLLTSTATVNATYLAAPTITISDPTGSGAQLVAVGQSYSRGGGGFRFYGIIVKTPGANYTNPTITITAAGGDPGAGASAVASLGYGTNSVDHLTIGVGGSGYSNSANIVLSGGGGNGAIFKPILSGGVLTGYTKISGGTQYLSAPAITFVDDTASNFNNGTAFFANGPNAGVTRLIKSATAFGITVMPPLEFVPNVDDLMILYAGCDHTMGSGGCAKFNNIANFRGFPFVPPATQAY